MGGAFVIHPVTVPMAAALTALHAESFGAECWSVEQIAESLAQPTTKAWIAGDADLAVGFILCQMIPREAEILTFCVSPNQRRQGVGAMLLRQAMAAVRENGGGKIFLEVAADNHAARKLYEEHGFATIGARANYYKRGAVTVDAVMYAIKV